MLSIDDGFPNEFLKQCWEALENIGLKEAEWYAGWNLGVYMNVEFPPPDCNFQFPTLLYGRPVHADFDLDENILELRVEDGSIVTIEIPTLTQETLSKIEIETENRLGLIIDYLAYIWHAFLDWFAPYDEKPKRKWS
jgi:hypothetical protein